MSPPRFLAPLLIGLGLVAYLALGISRITFEIDILKLLPEDLPETQGARLFIEHFLEADELLVLVENARSTEAETQVERLAERLEAQPQVASVQWREPVSDPDTWSELAAWALLNQSPEVLRELKSSLSPSRLPATLEAHLEDLATGAVGGADLGGHDPFGLVHPLLRQASQLADQSAFASADGRFRVLYVELARAPTDYRDAATTLAELRQVAEATLEASTDLWFTGEPAFLAEISQSMEGDMKRSGATTLVLTTLLVFLVFRRIRILPLLALCLTLVFLLTLATCGLIMGSLTVLTIGFGSILIGLSADYGVLVYQAVRHRPEAPEHAVREVRRSVLWAMTTTATVFLALLPLGFPGLSDLGILVSTGVLIGAAVMLLILPRLLRVWPPGEWPPGEWPPGKEPPPPAATSLPGRWLATLTWIVLLGLAAGLALHGWPTVDAASGSVRPRGSEAYAGLDRLEQRLSSKGTAVPLLVTGTSPTQVRERLDAAADWLEGAEGIPSVQLPTAWWPEPIARKTALEQFARPLVEQSPQLRSALLEAGFTDTAWSLSHAIFEHWRTWLTEGPPQLPVSKNARWMLERFLSIDDTHSAVLASVETKSKATLLPPAPPEGVHPVGSQVMNRVMNHYLGRGFIGISVIFGLATLALISIALRRWRPVVLVGGCMALSYLALLGWMSWLGLHWNAFTLPALLLSLGTGSDYFIHLILRMQREGIAGVGRLRPALVVCAGSSILGFGSLLTASSPGLSSMGLVCASAIAFNVLTALTLMPWLWQKVVASPESKAA